MADLPQGIQQWDILGFHIAKLGRKVAVLIDREPPACESQFGGVERVLLGLDALKLVGNCAIFVRSDAPLPSPGGSAPSFGRPEGPA